MGSRPRSRRAPDPIRTPRSVAERRAGEFERDGVRVWLRADVVPVEDVLAQRCSQRAAAGASVRAGEALRRRVRVGVERRPAVARVAGPPADRDLLGVHRVAHDEVLRRRIGGRPENRLTARSNEPHHALTGVERPRYGARKAASTSAARVAAAK